MFNILYVIRILIMKNKLLEAIEICGGQRKLANKLNVTQQAVSKWLHNVVPASHVVSIEKATERKVTRYDLRPDLYPPD